MKFYLAPMEGVTSYIYRNAYHKYFNKVDKYFTPFIIPTSKKNLKSREVRDVLPENNIDLTVVPQILTNSSEGFIKLSETLSDLGYETVNLNLGCPSGTVVSKKKGSGFLVNPSELDKFLEEIFTKARIKVSLKTRLGIEDGDEIYELLKIYNKYPLEELIVHPRVQKDFYKNKPNLEIFKYILKESAIPICYNGDIFTKEDYELIREDFLPLDAVMIGRGVIANPGLIPDILEDKTTDKRVLKAFHDEVLENYISLFGEERNALFKMKEIWWYMKSIFTENKKYIKRIRKSSDVETYKIAVDDLFDEQEIISGAGLFYDEG